MHIYIFPKLALTVGVLAELEGSKMESGLARSNDDATCGYFVRDMYICSKMMLSLQN